MAQAMQHSCSICHHSRCLKLEKLMDVSHVCRAATVAPSAAYRPRTRTAKHTHSTQASDMKQRVLPCFVFARRLTLSWWVSAALPALPRCRMTRPPPARSPRQPPRREALGPTPLVSPAPAGKRHSTRGYEGAQPLPSSPPGCGSWTAAGKRFSWPSCFCVFLPNRAPPDIRSVYYCQWAAMKLSSPASVHVRVWTRLLAGSPGRFSGCRRAGGLRKSL